MAQILIVDDEPLMNDWVELFNELGHKATIAKTGERGLEMLTENPDIVLLDYNMPGINGYQFSEMVRKNPNYMDIPLIGIGGFPIGSERQYLTEMLPKPFMLNDVLAVVKKYERKK